MQPWLYESIRVIVPQLFRQSRADRHVTASATRMCTGQRDFPNVIVEGQLYDMRCATLLAQDPLSYQHSSFLPLEKALQARRLRRCNCWRWSSGSGICKRSRCATFTSQNLKRLIHIYIFLAASKTLRSSVKVTLVEGGDLNKIQGWDMPPDAFSNRVVSLTNASLDFLYGVS